MTRTQYDNLEQGDILTSESRDAVKIVKKHMNGFYVVDCIYNDETQEYKPNGNDYLLTSSEIMKQFEV